MTDKELRKLSRADLIAMMLELAKENQQLREDLEKAQQSLESRRISIEKAGSLADAALQLNGVFEAAEDACSQYARNLQERSSRIQEYCARMEQQTREKCQKMVEQTQQEVDAYWAFVRQKARELYINTPGGPKFK